MRDELFYDFAELFERVLSFAIDRKFSLDFVEKRISYSSFFRGIEIDDYTPVSLISDGQLIKSLFPFEKIDDLEIPVYNTSLWASEAYLWIQQKTHLTFEAIFIYIPIKEMLVLFNVYHEMDFSHIVELFCERKEKNTVLSILAKKYKYSMKDISEKTNIPYDSLISLKNRRRKISSLNIATLSKLAAIFNVRIETLAELEQGE